MRKSNLEKVSPLKSMLIDIRKSNANRNLWAGDAEAERLFFDKENHLSKNELPQRQDPPGQGRPTTFAYVNNLDTYD